MTLLYCRGVLTPGLSLSAELSVLQAMEPVGEPDEAWQRLYQRITQQRNTSGVPGGNSREVNFTRSVLQPCACSPAAAEPSLLAPPWNPTVICSPDISAPIGSHAVPAAQMLKRGNEENMQVLMGGAPDAGSLQQMASQFGGQRKSEELTSKIRGAATSAEALTC